LGRTARAWPPQPHSWLEHAFHERVAVAAAGQRAERRGCAGGETRGEKGFAGSRRAMREQPRRLSGERKALCQVPGTQLPNARLAELREQRSPVAVEARITAGTA